MSDIGFYLPALREIASISAASPAVVTTVEPHGYRDGIEIRFHFPELTPDLGTPVLNGNLFFATVIDSTRFSVPSDTRVSGGFAGPNELAFTIPVGEDALTLLNATHNSGTIVPTSSIIER